MGDALVLHGGREHRCERPSHCLSAGSREWQPGRPLLDVPSSQARQRPLAERRQDVQPQLSLDPVRCSGPPVPPPRPLGRVVGHGHLAGATRRVAAAQQSVLDVDEEPLRVHLPGEVLGLLRSGWVLASPRSPAPVWPLVDARHLFAFSISPASRSNAFALSVSSPPGRPFGAAVSSLRSRARRSRARISSPVTPAHHS